MCVSSGVKEDDEEGLRSGVSIERLMIVECMEGKSRRVRRKEVNALYVSEVGELARRKSGESRMRIIFEFGVEEERMVIA